MHPNVLVTSHNCFSQTGSNGRTLANFFINWQKESLAQFYISNEIPDSPVCDNYFRVLDTEALKAFYKGSRVGKVINKETSTDEFKDEDILLNNLYKRNRKRTSFNYIARNLIWDSNRWKSMEFKGWVGDFNPDVILLQIGDYAFMFKIALSIAKERNIPLVLYNCEDYYFKDRKSLSILYHFYRSQYKKRFEKLMEYTSHTIYICDMLQETYNKSFKHKSTVIMTAAGIIPGKTKHKNEQFTVSYLGNLGVGRHEPLIEIGNALQNINENLKLDIYGKIPNEKVRVALKSCKGINYKGFINYQEVVNVMKNSDLLVHAENFSAFYQWDLKHAFSTKIADSLASGTCFFVYAPENMAVSSYLKKNDAACVVSDKDNLEKALREIIGNSELREKYVKNAIELVRDRFDVKKNAKLFCKTICDICSKEQNSIKIL